MAATQTGVGRGAKVTANLSGPAAERIVAQSLAHLLRLIRPDGRFIYAHPRGRPEVPFDGYNLLRHCGTLWFMLRAINDLTLDPGAEGWSALGCALRYAGGKLHPPGWIAGDGPCLALVTRDAVKTGGVGLALVMLAEARRAVPRGLTLRGLPLSAEDTVTGLQHYALAQISDGDFLHKRQFSDGAVLPFRSDYYTGEVLLGLIVTDCRDAGMITVAETLLHRRYGVAEQSHWMAYAACEACARGLLAPGLSETYLAALMTGIVENDSYRARAASTPIACRTEALTRFLMLDARHPGRFPPALIAAARTVVRENLALQLGWYDAGQFWKGDGDDKVQIDYIQHNATAFLNLRLLGG